MTRTWATVAAAVLVAACSPGGSTDPAAPGPTVVGSPTTAPSPSLDPSLATSTPPVEPRYEEYAVPDGTHPHDVAPADDGTVWYTAQHAGALGVLDPATGTTEHIPLGDGSAPHGVIVGPDGSAWVTDGGLDAIVRVAPDSHEVTTYPLPRAPGANLNTAAFDGDGILWFTGQAGVFGRLDPATGDVTVFDAPRGTGPYGIAATPDGTVWYASLAGSYIARIATPDGQLEVVDVPTDGGGARRVWSDSTGRLWVTEWFAGELARYDPAAERWDEWPLPGAEPRPYAVFVDGRDQVWVSDFATNALLRFDPAEEAFTSFPLPSEGAQIRQLLGRPGEVWGAGSGTDTLVVLHTG